MALPSMCSIAQPCPCACLHLLVAFMLPLQLPLFPCLPLRAKSGSSARSRRAAARRTRAA